jgi:hypothetical protein
MLEATNKDQIAMMHNEIQKKTVNLNEEETYHPVIASTGHCVLHLNIGGAKFRTFNKEIAKGLL